MTPLNSMPPPRPAPRPSQAGPKNISSPAKRPVPYAGKNYSNQQPSYSPGQGPLSHEYKHQFKKSDTGGYFAKASQVSRAQFERDLKKTSTLRELGQEYYKITGKNLKGQRISREEAARIADMIPKDRFGGFLDKGEIQRFLLDESHKIQAERKAGVPTSEITKEEEKVRFIKKQFGVK